MKRYFDRLLAASIIKQLFILSVLLAFSGGSLFLLGTAIETFDKETFVEAAAAPAESSTKDKLWYVIVRLLDPGNVADSEAKGFALLITVVGWVLYSGLLIAVITNAYFVRIDKIGKGLTRYKLKNHYLILGESEMTLSLIKQIVSSKQYNSSSTIVVHTGHEVEGLRTTLLSHLSQKYCGKLLVYRGERDSKEELRRLYPGQAKMIFIMGDTADKDGDMRNVDCAKFLAELIAHGGRNQAAQLRCYLYLENQDIFDLLQQFDVPVDLKKNLDLQPLNFYETWANKVLVSHSKSTLAKEQTTFLPLDYRPVTHENGRQVRLVIVGFTQMGYALAVQAARVAHFGNGRKTVITIVDKEIEKVENIFLARYPGIVDLVDIEVEFIQGGSDDAAIRAKLKGWATDRQQVLTIAICHNDPGASLLAGLHLPYQVYDAKIPILIRQQKLNGLVPVIKNDSIEIPEQRFASVYFFGMLEGACELDFDRDELARAFHADYLQRSKNDGRWLEGEAAFMEWDDLLEQYRWANRYLADSYWGKLRALGYASELFKAAGSIPEYARIMQQSRAQSADEKQSSSGQPRLTGEQRTQLAADIELLAEIEHNRWIAQRVFSGWQYGDIKDEVKKTSPFLIPYAELSEEIKDYDREPCINMFAMQQ